jgi:uncharacterized protein YbaR (Trm112 family)
VKRRNVVSWALSAIRSSYLIARFAELLGSASPSTAADTSTGVSMIAAIYDSKCEASSAFVTVTEVAKPDLIPGHLLLRVLACGVCRTDLHIVEADLPALVPQLIPGHQIVGEVIGGETENLPPRMPSRCELDGWGRWRLLVLWTQHGEPL